MSHEVETMAYAVEKPWHGLGVSVSQNMSDQEMLKAAGLDWQVSKEDMLVRFGGEEQVVSGKKALVRSTDGRILDVVGSAWNPVQNSEALGFFRSFVEAGEATMETAGSLHGGRLIWGLARLGQDFTVNGDRVNGYLLLASPHQSGKSVIARVTTIRVVCQNTLNLAMSESAKFEARFSHRYEFNPSTAREAIGLAREVVGSFEKTARVLMSLNLSHDDAVRILAPIYQPDTEVEDLVAAEEPRSRRLRAILESYQSAPGAQPGTGWGVLNGVTHWADHVAGRNQDQRLTSAWVGTESGRKSQILQSLLALAEGGELVSA